MKKIKLSITGLSYSQTQSGAYALILGEVDGKRRLPVIIGGFEAQAIAIEIEKMKPSRPLTHDLFKSFADNFGIKIQEILIYNLVDGIFYAKLFCHGSNNKTIEIDSRTSDAVAIAVRFNIPIYTYEFIMESAGIILDDGEYAFLDNLDDEEKDVDIKSQKKPGSYAKMSDEELNTQLAKAIEDEMYEKAAQIRDELSKRKSS